jgi:hypothetical protein
VPRDDGAILAHFNAVGVSKPPVWRRLQLHSDTRLDHLHEMIVTAFGWQDFHMHVFTSGSEEFGLPDPELGHTDERLISRPADRRHRRPAPLHL